MMTSYGVYSRQESSAKLARIETGRERFNPDTGRIEVVIKIIDDHTDEVIAAEVICQQYITPSAIVAHENSARQKAQSLGYETKNNEKGDR